MQIETNGEHGEGSSLAEATDLNELSEDCVAKVISCTTPCDAARVSSVSKLFKAAADSDPVWETFMPSDYGSLVPSSSIDLSRKELYLKLCDQPILIDDGKKSLYLEKKSGKKCCMLAPRDLYIVGVGDGTPLYWEWISHAGSRFPEVAVLVYICWLEICGVIYTQMLSKETLYMVYFVFKLRSTAYGFDNLPVEIAIEHNGNTLSKRTVNLDYEMYGPIFGRQLRRLLNNFTASVPSMETGPDVKIRNDGWMEVELGEFYNNGNMKEELKMSVREIERGNWKSGLIVQGFEIRPVKS